MERKKLFVSCKIYLPTKLTAGFFLANIFLLILTKKLQPYKLSKPCVHQIYVKYLIKIAD